MALYVSDKNIPTRLHLIMSHFVHKKTTLICRRLYLRHTHRPKMLS